eukprot:8699593-Lingulodinium_polyedra.AAC.1
MFWSELPAQQEVLRKVLPLWQQEAPPTTLMFSGRPTPEKYFDTFGRTYCRRGGTKSYKYQ